jgi:hypothetical protein
VTSELDEGGSARPELGLRKSPIVRDRPGAELGSPANPMVRDHPATVPARHLPIPGVLGGADVPRETPGTPPPVPRDSGDPSAGSSTPKHPLSGAVASVIDSTAQTGRSETAEPGSVTKAAGQGFASGFVGKLSNGSVPAADVQARMERFPELRGVQVPDGRAPRFPELGAGGAEGGDQQPAQRGERER